MTRTPSPADRALMEVKPATIPGAASVLYNGRPIGIVYRQHGRWYGLTRRTGRTTLGQPTRKAAVDVLWDAVLTDLDIH